MPSGAKIKNEHLGVLGASSQVDPSSVTLGVVLTGINTATAMHRPPAPLSDFILRRNAA